MSVVVIGGGGGKAAIDKVVEAFPRMTATQRAMAKAWLEKIQQDGEALAASVEPKEE